MVPDSSANSLRRHCPDQVKGYSAQCGSQPYGTPVFMSISKYSAAGRQKSTLADIIARPGA